MAARSLFCLILSLSSIWPSMASTAANKPDTYLVEYQAFRPSLYFTGDEGPEIATFTAIQAEPEWRKLWAELEPRLPRDMRESAPHPFPRIDFTRQTLLIAALGTKPTGGFSLSVESVTENPASITVNLVALNPGKGCGDAIYGITQITTHPIAMLLIPKTSKPVHFDTMQVEPACN
jgi:PrcB C-terminal